MADGILLIDKPADFTSFDVVAKARGILKTRRIGHAGTLDPMATGVLPLFIGAATKACDILPDSDKAYEASFALGVTTDTLDSTGTVLSRCEAKIAKAQVAQVLPRFTGDILQLPPMYSAVSVGGKRLYELARQGVAVERAPRQVTVHELTLLSFDESTQSGTLLVRCGKGTYVRTICHDLGAALGCGGVMTSLRRTMAAGFPLSSCITLEMLEDVAKKDILRQFIIPVEDVFSIYPEIHLNEIQSRMYDNGVKLSLSRVAHETAPLHRVYDNAGSFIGLGRADAEADELRCYKNFFPSAVRNRNRKE